MWLSPNPRVTRRRLRAGNSPGHGRPTEVSVVSSRHWLALISAQTWLLPSRSQPLFDLPWPPGHPCMHTQLYPLRVSHQGGSWAALMTRDPEPASSLSGSRGLRTYPLKPFPQIPGASRCCPTAVRLPAWTRLPCGGSLMVVSIWCSARSSCPHRADHRLQRDQLWLPPGMGGESRSAPHLPAHPEPCAELHCGSRDP